MKLIFQTKEVTPALVDKDSNSSNVTLDPAKKNPLPTKKTENGENAKSNGSKIQGIRLQTFQIPTADKYPALFFSHHPYFHQIFKNEKH